MPSPEACADETDRELRAEIVRLRAALWSIGHAAGVETKDDLMKYARAAIKERSE